MNESYSRCHAVSIVFLRIFPTPLNSETSDWLTISPFQVLISSFQFQLGCKNICCSPAGSYWHASLKLDPVFLKEYGCCGQARARLIRSSTGLSGQKVACLQLGSWTYLLHSSKYEFASREALNSRCLCWVICGRRSYCLAWRDFWRPLLVLSRVCWWSQFSFGCAKKNFLALRALFDPSVLVKVMLFDCTAAWVQLQTFSLKQTPNVWAQL